MDISENQKSGVKSQVLSVKKGFTLPELLIAVSILVIISTIAVVSFRGFDQTSKRRGARDQIIGDLQDMQSWAQSGTMVNICVSGGDIDLTGINRGICKDSSECTSNTCLLSTPPGGYGVYFDRVNNTYILFADIFNSSGKEGYHPESASDKEALIDGIKNLPASFAFGNPNSNYYNLSNVLSCNSFPLQIIFHLDGSAAIGGSGGMNYNIKIQKIPVVEVSSGVTAEIFVNRISGLIYSDTDSILPQAVASPSATPSATPTACAP